MFKYQINAINAAHTSISSQMVTFTSKFAPVPSSDKIAIAEKILGIFTDALGFISAGALSSGKKLL